MTERKLIFHTMFGSHLYGTDTPASDRDFKAVALPTDIEVLMMQDFGTESHGTGDQHRRNTSADTDLEIYSVRKFVHLLAQGQVMALDVLFAYPLAERNGDVWPIFRTLWNGREHFLTKNTATFAGYCKQQAAKYGLAGSRCRAALDAVQILGHLIEEEGDVRLAALIHRDHRLNRGSTVPVFAWLRAQGFAMDQCDVEVQADSGIQVIRILDKRFPVSVRLSQVLEPIERIADKYGNRVKQAEANEGIDWKALSHALRVCYEARELMQTGHITLPLRQRDREMVLFVKRGLLGIDETLDLISDHMALLDEAKARSTLRDEVDQEWLDTFVQKVHLGVVRGMAIQ